MKARKIGAAISVLGVLVVLTPWLIFPVCAVGRHAPPPGVDPGKHGCHDTLKAETAVGGLAIAAGLVPVFFPRKKIMMASGAGAAALGVLAILFPVAITGVCRVKTMPCVAETLPALVILGVLLAGAGAAGILLSRKAE